MLQKKTLPIDAKMLMKLLSLGLLVSTMESSRAIEDSGMDYCKKVYYEYSSEYMTKVSYCRGALDLAMRKVCGPGNYYSPPSKNNIDYDVDYPLVDYFGGQKAGPHELCCGRPCSFMDLEGYCVRQPEIVSCIKKVLRG